MQLNLSLPFLSVFILSTLSRMVSANVETENVAQNQLLKSQSVIETLLLTVGEQKEFSTGSSPVWIENSKVLRAKSTSSTLWIRGLKEGESHLFLGNQLYSVQVTNPLDRFSYKNMETELKTKFELSPHLDNGRLLLGGKLHDFEKWKELKTMSQLRHIRYTLATEFSKSLQYQAQEFINKELKTHGLNEQPLLFGSQLQVHLSSKEDLLAYEQLLNPWGIRVLQKKDALEISPTVKVQIFITELKKDFARQYGLQVPTSYSAQLIKGQWSEGDLNFNLKALENSGHARILARPNLICKSGKEAEFMAGGEFPIKVSNFKMSNVIWKQYGVVLKIRPLADPSGRMSISLTSEISNIDAAKTVDGVPGLFTHKVSSHFDLLKPETIALSGLIKSEDSQSQEGLSWIMNIPILGSLFSSKDFRENRTELVILVRPEILNLQSSDTSHLGKPDEPHTP